MNWRPLLAVVVLGMLISCQQDVSGDRADGNASTTRNSRISWELKPGYDYLHYSKSIKATLSVDHQRIFEGGAIDFEVRFDNPGSVVFLYNPFFYPNIPLPAALAVFDSNEHFVGDLLAGDPHLPFTGRRSTIDRDWIILRTSDYVGAHLIQTSQVAPTDVRQPIGMRLLAPGKYTVQLILFRAFAETDPYWKRTLPMDELFRSNLVQIEIVAKQ